MGWIERVLLSYYCSFSLHSVVMTFYSQAALLRHGKQKHKDDTVWTQRDRKEKDKANPPATSELVDKDSG